VRMDRILRDYREAGHLNGLIALWGFVDETTFLTKAGHVGLVYRLRGVDAEGLTYEQRRALVHRFEAALRVLDEHCRLSQYLLKSVVTPFTTPTCAHPVAQAVIERRAADLNARRDSLYGLATYMVLVYESPTAVRTSTRLQGLWRAPRDAMRGWLWTNQVRSLVADDLDRAITTLHQKAQAFEVHLGEFGAERLRKAEAFQFFRLLVNDPVAAATVTTTPPETHLDYFVADSRSSATAITCGSAAGW